MVQAFGHEADSLAAFDEVNQRLGEVSLKATFFSQPDQPCHPLCRTTSSTRGWAWWAPSMRWPEASPSASSASFSATPTVRQALQRDLGGGHRAAERPGLRVPGLCPAGRADQVPEAPGAVTLAPDGRVSLKDVSFRYPARPAPHRPIFSLEVQPGQRIAIVGPTGCGKTTLINLLMRFLRCGRGQHRGGRHRHPPGHPGFPAGQLRHGAAGYLAAGGHRPGKHRLRQARRHLTGDRGGGQSRPRPQLHLPAAPGLTTTVLAENGGNISQGPETAAVHRPGDALPAPHADFGRGHQLHRHPHRGAHPESLCQNDGGAAPASSWPTACPTIREADVILVMQDGHIVEQGTPRSAAGPGRLLCQAVQQPVRAGRTPRHLTFLPFRPCCRLAAGAVFVITFFTFYPSSLPYVGIKLRP